MELIFGIILPVFGTLGLGYAAARFGVFDEAANRGLSLFVFNFALPLMLFRAIARADLPDALPWAICCRITSARSRCSRWQWRQAGCCSRGVWPNRGCSVSAPRSRTPVCRESRW